MKNEKYKCATCNYTTPFKQNYNRHCNSMRHKQKTENSGLCKICNKMYKGRSGLRQHMLKEHDEDMNETNGENKMEMMIVKKNVNDIDRLTNLVEKVIKENHELQEMVIKMANEPKVVNTINNNRTYNIIAYLNKECGDAINMSDFIDNLELSQDDIDRIWETGYVDNVSRTFIGRLKSMEYNKRPIHCTDKKRKQFYIREKNSWNRSSGGEIYSCINKFNTKQLKQLERWRELNPEYKSCEDTFEIMCKMQRTLLEMYGGGRKKERMMSKIISVLSEIELRR